MTGGPDMITPLLLEILFDFGLELAPGKKPSKECTISPGASSGQLTRLILDNLPVSLQPEAAGSLEETGKCFSNDSNLTLERPDLLPLGVDTEKRMLGASCSPLSQIGPLRMDPRRPPAI